MSYAQHRKMIDVDSHIIELDDFYHGNMEDLVGIKL